MTTPRKRASGILHLARDGDGLNGLTKCCHKTIFELPSGDRVTMRPKNATCGKIKLTEAQRSLLSKLGTRTFDDDMTPTEWPLRGRALASAQVLRRYGFAEYVRGIRSRYGGTMGEFWRITPAGDAFATELAAADADNEG